MEIVSVTLPSRRPESQAAFYAEVIGAGRPAGSARVQIGATAIAFVSGQWAPQHFAMRIPAAAYADALDWLSARVELLANGDGSTAFAFPEWNADAAYFLDADGNVVEVIAHHDLPERFEPPFGPRTLLGVCEVGMPVDDVGAYLARLEAATGARRWDGDEATFAAAGEKRGSLIVVRRGRVWYPTRSARAGAGPLAV